MKIGLLGIGLDTYWPQFEGLKERLEGYLGEIRRQCGQVHGALYQTYISYPIEAALEA